MKLTLESQAVYLVCDRFYYVDGFRLDSGRNVSSACVKFDGGSFDLWQSRLLLE